MYDALNNEKREIRLLRILPTQDHSSQVECAFSPISLLDEPVYHALSYVWGDPEITTMISVNGLPFQATKNLASALRELRAKEILDLLWVDAICIDQSSVKEKNQQVPLMQDIYVKAQKTFVWLGDAGDEGELAFRLMRRWAAARDEALAQVKEDLLSLTMRRVIRDRALGEYRSDVFPPDFLAEAELLLHEKVGASFARKLEEHFDESEYTALIALRGEPYWGRVWIMQEFALAQDVLLLYGKAEIEYDFFKTGFDTMVDRGTYGLSENMRPEHLYLVGECTSASAYNLFALRSRCTGDNRENHFSIWELIILNQCQQSSNPLDAVYGLLGLVGSPEFPIIVDYSLSPTELFTQLTLGFLNHPSVGLDCLCLAGSGFQKHAINGPPSPTWVPNFASAATIYTFPVTFHNESDWQISAGMQIGGRELEVNGVMCCSVQEVRTWTADSDDPISQTLIEWLELVLSKQFGKIVRHQLGNSFPSTTEEHTKILSRFLEPAQISEFFSLEAPPALHAFAWSLAMSPLAPRNFKLETILEVFCGPANSPNSLKLRDLEDATKGSYYRTFESYLRRSIGARDTFFTTSDGYMGLGPSEMRKGDMVCSLPGCSYPLAIRHAQDDVCVEDVLEGGEKFQLIGACYIYGMMNGEIAADPKSKEKARRLIFV